MGYRRTGPEIEVEANLAGCSPERSLWVAVLEEVVQTEPAEDATRWLRSNDGRMVAALAGLDPDWIAEKILPAINRGSQVRSRRYRPSALRTRSPANRAGRNGAERTGARLLESMAV